MKKKNDQGAKKATVESKKTDTQPNTPDSSTEVNTAMKADQNNEKASEDQNSAAKNKESKTSEKSAPKQTNKVDTAKKATGKVQAKSADNNQAEADSAPTSKSGKVALVISIIALGLSGFHYYQSQLTGSNDTKFSALKQELSESVSKANATASAVKTQSESALAKANASLAEVNSNLQQLKAAETKKTADIDALQKRLTKSIQQVESAGSKQNSRKDWLLAEVEYLLRLANQRVLMEKTPIGALALLKSADQILKQTDDVSIFEVRKSLAADMTALSGVAHIDKEGLYLKIDALSAQINQLKLVPLTDKKQLPKIIDQVATDAVNDAQEQESSLSSVWNKASAKLEKLVVISHRDSAIEPLLSPAQQAGLLQNLHILFEQTQLSLLQSRQAPYTRSIEKAEQIISTYFQVKDSAAQALLTGLKELKSEQVSVELPSIAGSLNTLKAYLKQGAEIKSGAQE